MGYVAKFSQTQNATIMASPRVIVTITWADLHGLHQQVLGEIFTIDNLPTGVLGGKEQTHQSIK